MKAQIVFITSLLALALFVSHVMTGCTTQREAAAPIKTTELPVFEGEQDKDHLELSVLFLLAEDGSIEDLKMVGTSGDAGWDSAAADSIKNWHFPPPSDSEKKWVRRTVRVEIIPAEILNIGELIFQDSNDADLIYSRLRAGASFERLVRETRQGNALASEGRFRADIETTEYPIEISLILVELEEGKFSRPVEMGGKFVIFKRYGDFIPGE